MVEAWDHETDLLVVGAGAAGLTSALTAGTEGLQALVVEKTDRYGGTTALSGGVVWIPGNSLMAQGGDSDSPKALSYLKHNIGNRVGAAKLGAFVTQAPRMLDYLCGNGYLQVLTFAGFPDYRPEDPGGAGGGRSVEPKVFAGRKLGGALGELRARAALAPGGIVGTMTELRQLAAVRSDPLTALGAWKVFPRYAWNHLTGASHLSNGAALVAWLRHGLQKLGTPLWLNTPLTELITDHGAVVGARVNRDGVPQRIRARKGVVITAGGFEHSPAMRREFFGPDATSEYTSGAPGNTGDGINAGIQAGASVDLMDDAWWAPTFMPPGQGPQIVIFERGKPGNIIVNAGGQRFANEADPYNEFVKHMQDANRSGTSAIPAYMIFDGTYRQRYPLGGMLPGITPKRYLDNGFVTRADTLVELAARAGIDPAGLTATVKRFNEMAREGIDRDFHKGDSAFDRFAGDPGVKPNPCLAPLERPPFYAMRLYPGDLGTKGGLLTDESAQVVRADGTLVPGLYAAGNSSASVMGHFYPGAGGTIGPAMTFGFIAAMHAAGRNLQ